MPRIPVCAIHAGLAAVALAGSGTARADGDLRNVKHIIIVMQENHSFDNYLGALAYAPGTPYHAPGRDRDLEHGRGRDEVGGCPEDDHSCVDGLACANDGRGDLICRDSNVDDDGSVVKAFHDSRRCVVPDLDHSWLGTHREVNFLDPNAALRRPQSDGFVLVNDAVEQPDHGAETPTDDQTMSFYTQDEIPFYYDLAEKFAVSDRYFCSVLGPTFPNRSYLMAATSFGHLTTSDSFPPPGGYKPITGTIFDLLESHGISWADYFSDVPQGGSFRPFGVTGIDPHFLPVNVFLAQASGAPGLPPLPQISFVDPNFGVLNPAQENDEHPPTDIQRGQAFVSRILNAVRSGPFWKDSIVFVTYDEHGGFFDHVKPPRARQGGARSPDGIDPGQCADLSNVPVSLRPGGGAECSTNLISPVDTTVNNAIALCPALADDPTGPYPSSCANFDQLGVRVPLIVVSPFAKPHYVSHAVGDHTSLLALIEKRFLSPHEDERSERRRPWHLTRRDEHANTLEDLFDFDRSPSLGTPLIQAAPPADDCTPSVPAGAGQ
jgi:phospholipase C